MADTSKIDPRIEAEGIRVRADVPLEVIADRHFVNEDVWLDGRSFLRCHFTRCRLRIAWGWFEIRETNIDTDCTINAHGFAEGALNFVAWFNARLSVQVH